MRAPISDGKIPASRAVGLRLGDQGVNQDGLPSEGFLAGIDVRARADRRG